MKSQRWQLSKSNSYSSSMLHYRNPWIVIWWSLALPGFGHFIVQSYLFGFILMSFEYLTNTMANLNLSIYYSMLGEFDKAREVLDGCILVYITVYIYAVWDSYQRCVSLNKTYQLAYRQKENIKPMHVSTFEINPLGKKKPLLSLIWAFLMPVTPFIYSQRLPAVVFGFFWWSIILYFSSLLDGVIYTFIGDFQQAKAVLDPQWLLYIPSILGFCMFNSYQYTVENNKLFELAQSRFFKENYQEGCLNDLYKYKQGAN